MTGVQTCALPISTRWGPTIAAAILSIASWKWLFLINVPLGIIALLLAMRFLPNTKILTLCGGQPFGMQRDSLQHAPHIIVATPGRLLDHLQKGTVSLDALNTLVMDEADRMLDMGFSDAIDDVIRFAPASRQTLLFSATHAVKNQVSLRVGA